jgi:hypothetical protein
MKEPASISLPGSAASPLLPGLTASAPLECARSNPTAATSLLPTGQAFPSTTTRRRSTARATKAPGSSAAGHPASPLVLPGSSEARQITVGSGRKLSESLESQSPLGSCLRILLESNQWDSTECLLTWKRQATKLGRSIYQLAASIPRSGDSGSGLWATPRSSPSEFGTYKHCPTHGETHGELLCPQLNVAMWPTPTLMDSQQAGGKPTYLVPTLRTALWPTAWAVNWRSGKVTQETLESNSRPLQEVLVSAFGQAPSGSNAETASGGAPNPEFVAWLMGLPWDYLKHWETQSSGQLPLAL